MNEATRELLSALMVETGVAMMILVRPDGTAMTLGQSYMSGDDAASVLREVADHLEKPDSVANLQHVAYGMNSEELPDD